MFNELLSLTVHLPHNTSLIDYKDIFGTETPQLFNGVHLKRGEQATLAEYISSTLTMGETPEIPPAGSDLDFHSLLVHQEVISDVRAAPQLPSPFMEVAQPPPPPQPSAAASSKGQAHPSQDVNEEVYENEAAIDEAIRLLQAKKKALK